MPRDRAGPELSGRGSGSGRGPGSRRGPGSAGRLGEHATRHACREERRPQSRKCVIRTRLTPANRRDRTSGSGGGGGGWKPRRGRARAPAVWGLSSPTASRDRGRLQTCRVLREARSRPRLSAVLRTSHGYSAVAFIGLTGFGFFPTYVEEAVYFTQVAKDIWELKVALTFLSTLMFLGNKVIL